jgi:diguanylate cyclase (GGDEF)-like protein
MAILSSTAGPARFALRMSLRILVFADIANIVAHVALNTAGLLPYPLGPAVIVGLVITTIIAGPVSYGVIFLVGEAIRKLAINRNEFERLSSTDDLSGLMNRRAFFDALEAEKSDGVLLLIDIDQFKKINDSFGHQAGDDLICGVSNALRQAFGHNSDKVARIGGEEFAISLRGLDGPEGARVADEVRRTICASAMPTRSGPVSVSISVGVADITPGRSVEEIYKGCDGALYAAKVSGRNMVIHERARSGLRTSSSTGGTMMKSERLLAAVRY